MKFKVKRTSTYDEKPCEEAKEDEVWAFDFRCDGLKGMKERDENFFNPDYGEPPIEIDKKNSVRIRGKEKIWVIEINTFEEFMAFFNKYGELIIRYDYSHGETKDYTKGLNEIVIYDDYME